MFRRLINTKMVVEEIEGLYSKHLAAGSQEPPKVPHGKVRIYAMRFCPYAQRGLLALRMKQIPFEVVNVSTYQKPDWYLAKNPLGKVPCIEHDGKIVYESLVCAEYVDQAFPGGRKLVPSDPYEHAKQRMLVERLASEMGMAIFGWYGHWKDSTKIKNVEKGLHFFEQSLGENKYLAGDQPGYADFMMWPWLERLGAAELLSEESLKISQYKKLSEYIERMKEIPEIKTYLLDSPTHAKFLDNYLNGDPHYDEIIDTMIKPHCHSLID